jgi:hypothetical protein
MVAATFHFSEAEILGMPMERLRFWYRGVQDITRAIQAARGGG